MRCKTCHYSLENLTGPPHRCPECGTPFDPNDPATLAGQHFRWSTLLFRTVSGYVILLLLLVFLVGHERPLTHRELSGYLVFAFFFILIPLPIVNVLTLKWRWYDWLISLIIVGLLMSLLVPAQI